MVPTGAVAIVLIIALCQQLNAIEPLDSALLKDVYRANTPDEMKTACETWFRAATDDQIELASSSSVVSVALSGAWVRCIRRISAGEPPDAELSRFVGFVEGRLKTRVPPSWEKSARGARIDASRQVISYPRTELSAADGAFGEVPETQYVDRDGRQRKPGEFLPIAGRDVFIPGRYFEKVDFFGVDGAVLMRKSEFTYAIFYGAVLPGRGYPILVLKEGTDESIWKQRSWVGSTRRVQTGVNLFFPRAVITDNSLIVFWRSANELAIEGFALDDGRPRFRFSTDYLPN